MSYVIPDLAEARTQLHGRMTGLPAATVHLLPDMVLYGYAIDVLEQALAVETLTDSGDHRASFANARAAMEAAQDLLYLVRSESDYDESGSLARCHELLEYDDLKERSASADSLEGLDAPSWERAPAIVERDAAAWDAVAEGKGEILRGALQKVQPRRRRHWSGLSRRVLAERVAVVMGASPGWAAMHDALYGLASIHSHPRPRSGLRTIDLKGDTVVFGPRPEDEDVPAKLASLACLSAKDALDRRQGFFLLEKEPDRVMQPY